MKGVILCGGLGSRLRPITYSVVKQLVPVANKPIVLYGLEDLVAASVTDIGIIVSPQSAEPVRDALGDGSAFGASCTYIVQDEPLGLAHALNTAMPFVGDDDVLMYLGDNIIDGGVADIAADFRANRPNCQILLARVPNPTSYGVAEVDADGTVLRLVEKPSEPPSDLALVGAYLFDSTVREALNAISPSARGEYEITDAIQYLIDTGKTVRPTMVSGWWKDTGRKDDLLHAQHLVLGSLESEVAGEVTDTEITGSVRVEDGARVVGSTLRGPVVIGRDAVVEGCTLGPDVAVGDRSRLTNAAAAESILFDDVTVEGWHLRHSIVGRGSHLLEPAPAGEVAMTLGELSEVTGA